MTKSVLLGTGFPGRVAAWKRASGAGLRVEMEGNETAGVLVWELLGAEAVLDFSQPGEEKVPIRAELDYSLPFFPNPRSRSLPPMS